MLAKNIPNHVAIIMDGNGRWALSRGKNRVDGHKAGADTLFKTIQDACSLGINYLSVYAFSTENFKRPQTEVNFIMALFVKGIKKHLKTLLENDIKIVFSGREKELPNNVVEAMNDTSKVSKNNKGLVLNICINYGGHAEIVDMVKSIVNNHIEVDKINEALINNYLYHNLPAVDLLIRTSGEQRISNFMLWQVAYAEMYFSKLYWPEFNLNEFKKAISTYQKRDRRFGGLK